jgi:paraquat-inducible protein B
MSGSGGTADPDEATELRAFIRKSQAELERIQGQVDELKAALDKEPFEPVRRLKTLEAANMELQQLRAEKASTQRLLDGYNQRLLLLQQAAIGGCTYFILDLTQRV